LELADLAEEASMEARRSLLGEDGMLSRRFEELEMRQRIDQEMAALGQKGQKEGETTP
jgi:hypothetical protein